jgi:hypothetical protein
MRILYSHRVQSHDGQGVHIEEMVRALRRAGHEVMVHTLPRCWRYGRSWQLSSPCFFALGCCFPIWHFSPARHSRPR